MPPPTMSSTAVTAQAMKVMMATSHYRPARTNIDICVSAHSCAPHAQRGSWRTGEWVRGQLQNAQMTRGRSSVTCRQRAVRPALAVIGSKASSMMLPV